jgi:hypothetical protein
LIEEKTEDGTGGTVIASELSVFLGSKSGDDRLIQLLTKLYDSEDILDYHTILRGKEVAHKVYMNMIGGTTPEWIKSSMPAHAIGGGFTSRIVFVYQFEPDKLIPFPKVSNGMRSLRSNLIHDLHMIGGLRGRYELSKGAIEWYEAWYTDVFGKSNKKEGVLDGYYGRKHDTLLKVGMCMSAARGDRMVIEDEDLEVALDAINQNEKYLPQVVKSVLSTQVGEDTQKVYKTIVRRVKVSFTDVLRNVSYCMDSKRVNEILTSLMEEEVVEEYMEGNKRWFRVKERK